MILCDVYAITETCNRDAAKNHRSLFIYRAAYGDGVRAAWGRVVIGWTRAVAHSRTQTRHRSSAGREAKRGRGHESLSTEPLELSKRQHYVSTGTRSLTRSISLQTHARLPCPRLIDQAASPRASAARPRSTRLTAPAPASPPRPAAPPGRRRPGTTSTAPPLICMSCSSTPSALVILATKACSAGRGQGRSSRPRGRSGRRGGHSATGQSAARGSLRA